jgi:alginate O-acetyltransferase complex protein AlgI
MLLCIVCNYFIGLWAGRDRKGRGPLLAGIFVNLGIIFVFKYLVFTLENLNLLFGGGLRIPVIDLRIGISFFTLQALSYILDVRRGRREAQKNPVNVGLYIAFFPQLIAGPIVRYETIADEIRGRHENWEDFSSGVGRFVFGLGKKVLLANPLALVAGEAVRQCLAGTLSVSFAWVGASVYILQLYFDFSGYSDMAIGLGRMFGFHFLENFRYPYTAKTLTDFWRRWHISLGSWFQDYVYIPLGGSRVSRGRLVFNLLVTWFLTGLWHGASWTFVVWGFFTGRFSCSKNERPRVTSCGGIGFRELLRDLLFHTDASYSARRTSRRRCVSSARCSSDRRGASLRLRGPSASGKTRCAWFSPFSAPRRFFPGSSTGWSDAPRHCAGHTRSSSAVCS